MARFPLDELAAGRFVVLPDDTPRLDALSILESSRLKWAFVSEDEPRRYALFDRRAISKLLADASAETIAGSAALEHGWIDLSPDAALQLADDEFRSHLQDLLDSWMLFVLTSGLPGVQARPLVSIDPAVDQKVVRSRVPRFGRALAHFSHSPLDPAAVGYRLSPDYLGLLRPFAEQAAPGTGRLRDFFLADLPPLFADQYLARHLAEPSAGGGDPEPAASAPPTPAPASESAPEPAPVSPPPAASEAAPSADESFEEGPTPRDGAERFEEEAAAAGASEGSEGGDLDDILGGEGTLSDLGPSEGLAGALEEIQGLAGLGVRQRDPTPRPPAEDFVAHPLLEAPAEIAPEARFEAQVGFRAEADPELESEEEIRIADPPPDARVLVLLYAEGARVEGKRSASIPLRLGVHHKYHLRALPGADRVRLSIDYVWQDQVVGSATRLVEVAGATRAADEPAAAGLPIRTGTGVAGVDITVSIVREAADELVWSLASPYLDGEEPFTSDPVRVPDRAVFAKGLIHELEQQGNRGQLAANVVLSIGMDVANLIPPEIFQAIRAVHDRVERPPVLLLRTEELLIPWELALMPEPLDPSAPRFLGAQTVMGRWLRADEVPDPPPQPLPVTRFSAVAAGYGGATGLPELAEALGERDDLVELLRNAGVSSEPLDATLEDLLGLVSSIVASQRHALHFAVHGIADPVHGEESLMLADKRQISANALMGPGRHGGEHQSFSFVFLNACQVGTAGESLGQAAGFPGICIRRGAWAFAAPLWEVKDAPARQVAEGFYRSLLDGSSASAGEYFLRVRRSWDPADTMTPMAYVFYGHPKLRLEIERGTPDA